MISNRDIEYDWVVKQPVVQGIDKTRGTDGRGTPSPIEDSILQGGILIYTNPRIRSRFHAKERTDRLYNMLVDGLGSDRVGKPYPDKDFDTSKDSYGRVASRLTVDGVDMPLARAFYFASFGKDANGKDIYDQDEYDLGVDKPGVFTSTTWPGDDNFVPGEIKFIPAKLTWLQKIQRYFGA